MDKSEASRDMNAHADIINLNFPRLISLDELNAMFRETTGKRDVEFFPRTEYAFTIVKGFPTYSYLSRCYGNISCKNPLGFILFDTELERVIYDNVPKNEIKGIKFYVSKERDVVTGNPDAARLIRDDITLYFVEHPVSQG